MIDVVDRQEPDERSAKNLMMWVVVAVVLMLVFQSFSPKLADTQALDYDQFVQQVQDDRIAKVTIAEDRTTITGERKDGEKFTTYNPGDKDLVNDLINHDVAIDQTPPASGPSFWMLVINFLPWLLFIGIWIYFMRQMQQGGGKGAMSFGRSRAKLQGEDQSKITFADVAGCDEAKEEVSELVEFLRDPVVSRSRRQDPARRADGRPPVTGTTLLAKASRRGQGAVLPFPVATSSRFRRRRRIARARHVRAGQETRAMHHLHRRDRRRWPPSRRGPRRRT